MTAIRRVAAGAALAMFAIAGCESSADGSGGAGGGSTPPPHPPAPIQVGAGDNGRTVHVRVGQTITLRLTSTYWRVAAAQPGTVLQTGDRSTHPAHSSRCVPGQGCGVVTARFTAAHPGRAVIAASRTSCGEALRCTPDRANYRVRVVVGA